MIIVKQTLTIKIITIPVDFEYQKEKLSYA